MNRKGDEYVEAAMVLPILILTILSLIMLMVYFFSCLNAQVDMHKEMVKESLTAPVVFDINEKSRETSSQMGGVVSLIMKKEIEGKMYEMKPADMIRAGEMLDVENE